MTNPIIITNPTIDILFLICAANAILYLIVYPKLKKKSLESVAKWDVLFSLGTLGVITANYFGSGYKFDVFGFSLGWFWFAVIVYTLLDTILSFLYLPSLGMKR